MNRPGGPGVRCVRTNHGLPQRKLVERAGVLDIGDEETHAFESIKPFETDGAYFTGMVFPGITFRTTKRSTYSSAASLAPDVLKQVSCFATYRTRLNSF